MTQAVGSIRGIKTQETTVDFIVGERGFGGEVLLRAFVKQQPHSSSRTYNTVLISVDTGLMFCQG